MGQPICEDDRVDGRTYTTHDRSQGTHDSGGDSNVVLIWNVNGTDGDSYTVRVADEGRAEEQKCNGLCRSILIASGDTFE